MEKKNKKDRLMNMEDEKIGKLLSMNINREKTKTECPSEENLACFIEGKLDNVTRDAIMGHMNSCDDCYDTFKSTIEIQRELEEEECNEIVSDTVPVEDEIPGVPLIPLRSIILRFMPYPLAAAAAILIMFYVFRDISIRELSFVKDRVAVLVKYMGNESAPSSYKHETSHNLGFSDTYSTRGKAFSIGVYLTDLEIALTVEDKENALALLNDVLVLLNGGGEAGKSIAFYESVKKEIEEGASLKEFAVQIDMAASEVHDPEYARFGQWCEGGRIAAVKGIEEYYDINDIETFIKWQENENLPKGILKSLHKIEKIVSGDVYAKKQFILLKKQFVNIIVLLRN